MAGGKGAPRAGGRTDRTTLSVFVKRGALANENLPQKQAFDNIQPRVHHRINIHALEKLVSIEFISRFGGKKI